jgi:hypothetical protein
MTSLPKWLNYLLQPDGLDALKVTIMVAFTVTLVTLRPVLSLPKEGVSHG